MTDAEHLQRFERRQVRGSFYLRDRTTGKRTRCYTTLEACYRVAEQGLLYTDTEYAALVGPTIGAALRTRIRSA